ncbi:MAG TPA: A/G-specific adenine glycosylase [Clostridia bacterium]|nr:A/G-specific adenine glycosylase [Clostridia bacterium]
MTRSFTDEILAWFDENARRLPWRIQINGSSAGCRRDPYAVVVSEFMLQQTQVRTVIPYYDRFMKRFPTFQSLAKADETEVLKFWEGLGYYRRAKQLLALARQIVSDYKGVVPQDRAELLKLPGIGPYTAGAVLSFAYNLPEAAVDGNVVRVFARLDAEPHVQGDVKAQREVRRRVSEMMPALRAGDFSEALIELGATVCLPAAPACAVCPARGFCKAWAHSMVDDFPVRAKPLPKPVSQLSYVLFFDGDRVFCRRRPDGLLAGLYEFLSFPHKIEEGEADRIEDLLRGWMGEKGRGIDLDISYVGKKRSVFSHRIWEISFWEVEASNMKGTDRVHDRGQLVCEGGEAEENQGVLVTPAELASFPFPAFLMSWRDDFIRRTNCANDLP